jgi:hypothetical protein
MAWVHGKKSSIRAKGKSIKLNQKMNPGFEGKPSGTFLHMIIERERSAIDGERS